MNPAPTHTVMGGGDRGGRGVWSVSPENSTEEGTPELARSRVSSCSKELTRTCFSSSMRERSPSVHHPIYIGERRHRGRTLAQGTGQVGQRGAVNPSP